MAFFGAIKGFVTAAFILANTQQIPINEVCSKLTSMSEGFISNQYGYVSTCTGSIIMSKYSDCREPYLETKTIFRSTDNNILESIEQIRSYLPENDLNKMIVSLKIQDYKQSCDSYDRDKHFYDLSKLNHFEEDKHEDSKIHMFLNEPKISVKKEFV